MAKYINTTTGRYPLSLDDIRRENATMSLPRSPKQELLSSLGYELVVPTDKPIGGEWYEGEPENDDGVWKQTWSPTQPKTLFVEEDLEDFRKRKLEQLQRERKRVFNKGTRFSFGDVTYRTSLTDETRIYLSEVFMWVNLVKEEKAWFETESLVKIPVVDETYIELSISQAKPIVRSLVEFCHRAEEAYLTVKKKIEKAQDSKELSAFGGNMVETLMGEEND